MGYKQTTSGFKPWLLAFGAVFVALAVFACGGDDDSSDDAGNGASADPTATASDQAPADQQVLRLRLSSEPPTLDPHLGSLQIESSINKQLFSGLFGYDENLNVVPNLAREMPTVENGGVSEDGLTYTIKLVDGATWSDGKPLTAGDFVYSMKRALDPSLGAPYVSFFYAIDGAAAYNQALGTPDAPLKPSDAELSQLRDAVGVSATDDQTIVYTLSQPTPSFLNYLALWTAYPVREDAVEQYGAQWTEAENHIGNGPFVLAEWQHNQRIVLEPNQNWHGETPVLSRIEVNIIADDAAAYAAYLADELDVVAVPPPSLPEVQTPGSALHDQLVEVPDLSTFYVYMNNTVAPFDNAKVREAFAKAIDREALVEGVLQGGGRATTTWIPIGMPGHDANAGTQLGYDPAAAKAALAEAGYPNGEGLPEINFLWVDVPMSRVLAEFVVDQIEQNLGIEVNQEFVDGPTFGGRFTSKQAQATIVSWGADWPYPDNWLPALYSSDSPGNLAGYSNADFDDLMQQAASETDNDTRLDLYEQAQKLLLNDVAIAPLFNLLQPIVVKPWVKGLAPTGLDGEIKGDYSLYKTYIAAH